MRVVLILTCIVGLCELSTLILILIGVFHNVTWQGIITILLLLMISVLLFISIRKRKKIGWYLGLIFGICLFIEFGRAYWILTSRLALFEKVGIKTMARGLVLSSLFVGGILGELLTYIGLRKNYFYHSNGK